MQLTTKAQRKANRLSLFMKIKKNINLISLFIITCILPLSYLNLSNKGKEYSQDIISEQGNIKVYQELLSRETEDKDEMEKKIGQINEDIKVINDNIDFYKKSNQQEQYQNIQFEVNAIKDKINKLIMKKEELTNEYMLLKQKYDIQIGDHHQNEENNEMYNSKKDRNERFKNLLEGMKKNSFNPLTDFKNIIYSSIIHNLSQLDLLKNWIHEKNRVQFRLIYSGKHNGDLSTDFHKKVDNISPTLSIIRDNQGFIYGGYTEVTWNLNDDTQQKKVFKTDNNAFIFTLNTLTKYPINDPSNAILIGKEFLCSFGLGVDLLILENCIKNPVYNSANFPYSYGDKRIKKNELTNFNDYFHVEEIEVFQIFK